MKNSKFLQQIADYYIEKDIDLGKLTFVFPNRRAAMFMRKYIKEATDHVRFMPRLVSMRYFTSRFNANTLATDDELLFILYNAYCNVLKRHDKADQIPVFDSFIFWGRILIKDFNDVDEYLVDTKQLFHNIKGVKEISSNYLTPEQVEAIEMLWGKECLRNYSPDRFWNHIIDENDKVKGDLANRFINLWQILDELYTEFRKELDNQPVPLGYSGMLSRNACNKICECGKEDFGDERFVFIGFDSLTTAQNKIFKQLRDLGIADFFWDIAFIDKDSHEEKDMTPPAIKHILPLLRNFPMPEDFTLLPLSRVPEVEIVSVPSNIGQTKYAHSVLEEFNKEWDKKPESKPEELIQTSIVLANPALLTNMLYSIPPEVAPINVTMGVPFSATPFAALLSAIITMQYRVRIIHGEPCFFYRDILNVLMHPHILLIAPADSLEIRKEINKKHLFSISAADIAKRFPELEFVFRPISDHEDASDTRSYLVTLVETLRERIAAKTMAKPTEIYEVKILDAYALAIDNIYTMAVKHMVKMGQNSFLQMLERTLASQSMNFSGKPLEGLQIMGLNDTRLIDFENIVVLSMNEDVFPGKQSKPSFIPAALRHGYYMPTQETDDSRNSYLFFRLLSRAKSVKLVYDNRTTGISSGEMSRYLSQLLNLPNKYRIKRSTIVMNSAISSRDGICIDKTDDVIADLHRFRPGGNLNLSASALKTFLKCPLKFYLEYVKCLKPSDSSVDYIDAASSGSVLHKVAEELYRPFKGERITVEILNRMQKLDLRKLALEALDSEYYKGHYKGILENIPGEGKILAKITARFIHTMLEEEKKFAPFTFMDAESGEKIVRHWQITPDYELNFKMSVDRIDRLDDGTLRFIDYKTGEDEVKSTSIDSVFSDMKKFGGVFQLLVYCEAYTDLFNETAPIQPIIYKFKDMAKEGIRPITINNAVIDDFRKTNPKDSEDGFRKQFNFVIHRIFEEENEYPFSQTENEDDCLYCQFATMCHRFPDSRK